MEIDQEAIKKKPFTRNLWEASTRMVEITTVEMTASLEGLT